MAATSRRYRLLRALPERGSGMRVSTEGGSCEVTGGQAEEPAILCQDRGLALTGADDHAEAAPLPVGHRDDLAGPELADRLTHAVGAGALVALAIRLAEALWPW